MILTKPNPRPPQKDSYDLANEVVLLLLRSELIQAVKLIKEWTGMGLYDSKRVIDIVRAEAIESYGYLERDVKTEETMALTDFAEGALIATMKYVG